MIRHIRGIVRELLPEGAVFDVSGFGVFVFMNSTEGLVIGKETTIQTYLAVKQDGIELYGFRDEKDLVFFTRCLLVPGIGPKTALSILKRAPRVALENAIAKRDISYLTRVVGLGKKSAEKIIVELAEKMDGGEAHQGDDTEVFDTLVALGYTEREARRSLANIPENVQGKDARLKAALSGAH